MDYVAYLIDRGWDFRDINYIKRGISRGNELLEGNNRNYAKKSYVNFFILLGMVIKTSLNLNMIEEKVFSKK